MIRVCLHCGANVGSEPITAGALHFDGISRFTYHGEPLTLQPCEALVLEGVIRADGASVGRWQLMERAGNEGDNGNILSVWVHRIRKKLLAIDPDSMPLVAVRGRGMKWVA